MNRQGTISAELSAKDRDSAGPIGFEAWWADYPRKTEKRTARKAFQECLNRGTSAEIMTEGLKRHLPDLRSREPKFVPYPATWLRAGSWESEPLPPQKPKSMVGRSSDYSETEGMTAQEKDDWVMRGVHK